MKPLVITDARTAELLLNPDFMSCLESLMQDQWAISALAKKLGASIGSTHYRVQQLLERDLAMISQEQQRAGRSIKYYTATAKAFFVPFLMTDFETLLAFWSAILQPKHDAFVHHLIRNLETRDAKTWGVLMQYTPEHGFHITNAAKRQTTASHPVAWFNAEDLYLTHEQARELQLELRGLIEKYQQNTGSEHYILQNGLVWTNETT